MMDASALRDAGLGSTIAEDIARLSRQPRKLMEVCGSHAPTIARYGIRELLPPTIELVPAWLPGVRGFRRFDLAIDLPADPRFGDYNR